LIGRLFKKEKNLEHTRDPKYSSTVKKNLNRELDIVRLIKTIKKLKATVSCLVNERKDRGQLVESAKAINNREMTVSIANKQKKSKFERFIDDSSSDENPETMVQSTLTKAKPFFVQNNQTPSHSQYSEASQAPAIAHTEHLKIQSSSTLPVEKLIRPQTHKQKVFIPFQPRDGSETKRDRKKKVTSLPYPLATN
jgi:hypothetical protein